MVYAGLDLSRRRLDVRVLAAEGDTLAEDRAESRQTAQDLGVRVTIKTLAHYWPPGQRSGH